MVRLDRRARLCLLPSQKSGLLEAVGLTQADVESAAWALTTDGRLLRGPAALGAALDRLLTPMGSPLASLFGLPVIRPISDRAYAEFAARRGAFGGHSACSIRWPKPLDAETRDEIERRLA